MNELFSHSPWVEAGVQIGAQSGLALLGQTSLLLAIGLLVLHVLQKRYSGAGDVLGRALLVSTLAGVALSFSLSLNGWNRPAALWNVSLPAARASNTPSVFWILPSAWHRAEQRASPGSEF